MSTSAARRAKARPLSVRRGTGLHFRRLVPLAHPFSSIQPLESTLLGAFSEMTEQDEREARAELEGAEFIVETHSVYETAPDLEVPLPPEAT